MNWKTINNNNPKAFEKLIIDFEIKNYEIKKHGALIDEPKGVNIRLTQYDAIDFLDNSKIFINVTPSLFGNFEASIYNGIVSIESFVEVGMNYKTRHEARKEAVSKAFELLEEKLNKKNQ